MSAPGGDRWPAHANLDVASSDLARAKKLIADSSIVGKMCELAVSALLRLPLEKQGCCDERACTACSILQSRSETWFKQRADIGCSLR